MTQASSPSIGVVVRRYGPLTYAAALDLYETDLPQMVAAGYFPVGQSWGTETQPLGNWGSGGVLAVTYRYDPWAMAERRLEGQGGTGGGTAG